MNDFIELTIAEYGVPVLIRIADISSVTADLSPRYSGLERDWTWVRISGDCEGGFLVKESYSEIKQRIAPHFSGMPRPASLGVAEG